MKTISAKQRLTAAALAISVTFSMVWSVASLGYPASVSAYPASSSATLSVCRGS
jgi:hypothetical protein